MRYFFPSPEAGSACKRLNLYLRWMARRDGVDLGVWRRPDPSQLILPIDAHTFAIARRVRLTRYRSPGWAMALDVTRRLRKLDPGDPVKYDFAFHRMGLLKRQDEVRSLLVARDPPALPGRPPKFDSSGKVQWTPCREPLKAHDREYRWTTTRA